MELRGLRLLSRILGAFNNICIRKDGTVNRKLEKFMCSQVPARAKPVHGVSTVDVVVDFNRNLWVRLFIPNKEISKLYHIYKKVKWSTSKDAQPIKTTPVVVFFHGGGFVFKSPECKIYDTFCRNLARKCHALVISVNYRRAPEHKFPVAYEDGYLVLRWLAGGQAGRAMPRHIDPASIDLSRVYLCGDEAGGNIAHHVAVQAAQQSDVERQGLTIRGLMLLSPLFGGQERTPAESRLKDVPMVSLKALDWSWKSFLPHGSNRDHPACNIFGRNSPDLAPVALPPMLVIIGGLDILQDWQMRYADCLNRAGKDVKVFFYKGGIHTFGLFDQAKIAKQMYLNITGFIDNH